jgi:hypothetical protein
MAAQKVTHDFFAEFEEYRAFCEEDAAADGEDVAARKEEEVNCEITTWKAEQERKANIEAPPTQVSEKIAEAEEAMPRKKKVSSPDTSPTKGKVELVYKGDVSPGPTSALAASFSGRSIKELYFFDLQHTRELYKNFDVKLQVLYVLMKSPYGIAINQLRKQIGLRGNTDHIREKIKDALCFWNSVGIVSVVYDSAVGTMPSPMMWECLDVEKAKELLSAIAFTHTALKTEAQSNGGLERLYLGNRDTTYAISVGKKTRRTT